MSREEIEATGAGRWKRAGVIAVTVFALLYAGDYVLLSRKMHGADQSAAFGAITSYYGTATKGGKMEIFTDQPQIETCVHSLFPHSGYRACWYISGGVKQI
jgi:hypothetical protein